MRKKISGIFGLLVLALLLAVGMPGGMVKAGDVEEGETKQCQHETTEKRNEKEATCEEEGYTGDIYCKECNAELEKGEVISKDPENHIGETITEGALAATCETAGNKGKIICKSCGQIISSDEIIPAKGHKYGPVTYEWSLDRSSAEAIMTCQNDSQHTQVYQLAVTSKVTKVATCAANGEVTYTANASIGGKGYKDVKVVTSNKNPQNHVGGTKIVNAKSATCTAKGYTGDTVCASCGVQRERGSEIQAKGYKWNKGKATKKSTDKSEGVFTYTCTNGCRHTKTEIIPRKSITVDLGKKAKIISKASGCKMALANASKYKKYLTFNAKTGEIRTKKYYKVKINKSIPVKVKIGGKNYTVKVKIKIPAPKTKEFKISKKNVKDSSGKFCRYTFKYNFKGASKIQVRVENASKTGKEKTINKILDKYVKKPKSNNASYIRFSNNTMKKFKNNKVTFKIIVYYGKNKSETLMITK